MARSEQQRRVTGARARLILQQPFFGVLALRLKIVEDARVERGDIPEGADWPTMWCNGKSMGFNPAFVDTLSADELEGVVAHEVMHASNGHCWRRGHRHKKRWNYACDYAINPVLVDAGFRLPENGLNDPKFEGLSAEEIYNKLPELPAGVGVVGDVRDSAPDAPTEADWQQATIQAAKAAKAQGAGRLPKGVEQLVEDLAKPRIDWRAYLHRFVQMSAREDYSWTMPNRRWLARGTYMPALRSEEMPTILVIVDTSGSTTTVLPHFLAELQGAAAQCRPRSVRVWSVDTEVHDRQEFEAGDDLKPSFRGGGGTIFEKALEEARDEPDVACVIYFTDGYPNGGWGEHPGKPMLWAITSETIRAPFGESIWLDPSEVPA